MRVFAIPRSSGDGADERAAKIANLQRRNNQDQGQQKEPKAVALRNGGAERGSRANYGSRDKDKYLEAQAEHGTGQDCCHCERRQHCKGLLIAGFLARTEASPWNVNNLLVSAYSVRRGNREIKK